MATVQAKPQTPPLEKPSVKPPYDRAKARRKLKNSLKAYLFIAPAVILLFVFDFFSIFYAFFLSLYERLGTVIGLVPPAEKFGGLNNYGTLLADPNLWNAFFNTLTYAIGVVVVGLGGALGISLMIDKVSAGKNFYRTAFFLPNVTSLVAVGAVWIILFAPYTNIRGSSNALVPKNPEYPGGFINWVLSGLGLPMQRWINDETGVFSLLFNKVPINILPLLLQIIMAAVLFGLVIFAGRRANSQTASILTGAVGLGFLLCFSLLTSSIIIGAIVAALVMLYMYFSSGRNATERAQSTAGWAIVIGGVLSFGAFMELCHLLTWTGWMQGPSLALISLIIIAIWHGLGFNIVIILAGLTNISKDYYEAAKIDGAHGWSMFARITFPLLSPTMFFLLITSTIHAFQSFTVVYGIHGTNPPKSTVLLSFFYYNAAFTGGSGAQTLGAGYGSTIVIFMVLIIMSLSYLQQNVLGKRVNYD